MTREWLSSNQEKELTRKSFDVSIKPNGKDWELTVECLSPEECQQREDSLRQMMNNGEIEDFSVDEALIPKASS